MFLAAPGGTGKTTLSKVIELLFNKRYDTSLISVGIDGFHFKNEYLDSHYCDSDNGVIPLRKMKGFYNTYDTGLLQHKIDSFLQQSGELWPTYSRIKHDVVDDSIPVESDILLIEGNWLLDNDPRWKELKNYCDYSIFIEAPIELLHERLVSRKIRGGLTPYEAEDFYKNSDLLGVQRVLGNHSSSDIVLDLDTTGHRLSARRSHGEGFVCRASGHGHHLLFG